MSRAREQANLSSDSNIFVDIANDRTGIGITTPSQKLEIAGNIKLGDNQEILIGTGSDLKLWHDGTHSYIRTTSGTQNLNLQTTNGQVILGEDGGHIGLYYQAGGTVELRYNNTKTFETVSGGSKVTGNLEVTGGNITLGDSGGASDDRIVLGAGSDLLIYHNGTRNLIECHNGVELHINKDTSESCAKFKPDAEVELFYNNVKTFETTSTGVKIQSTGNTELGVWAGEAANAELHLYADENDDNIDHWKISANGADSKLNIQNHDGSNWESVLSATPNGAVKLYYNGTEKLETTNAGIGLNDSVKAMFGNGGDLSIYHDSTDSYIKNNTNRLMFGSAEMHFNNVAQSENMAKFFADGAVELYFDGTKRLETTGTGVNITDNLNVAGIATVAGIIDANGGANISGGAGLVASTAKVSDLTDNRVVVAGTGGELEDSGNLTFDGSTLLVTGTLNSTVDVQINGTSVSDTALNDAVAMAIALG